MDGKAFLGRGWSFPVRVDATGRIALSEYEDDVREAIRLVLLTSPGERVMRPAFGSGVADAVFATLNTTNLGTLQGGIRRALIRFEPRILVEEVKVRPDGGAVGRLLVDLQYRVRATNTRFNQVFPFNVEVP